MNDVKKKALTHFEEEMYRERVNVNFSDIVSCINANIGVVLDAIVRLIFKEIKNALFVKLFK